MAVICATRIRQKRLGVPRIVTFGQPRVGDKAVAKWIDAAFPNSYQRFVNDNDIVARLPYSNWLFPYSDAGRFIHLDRGSLRLLTGGRTEMLASSAVPKENKLLTYTPQQIQNRTGLARGPVGGSSDVKTREVYQATDAMPPLEESELDQLISEEQSLSQQRSAKLYFPNANADPPMTLGDVAKWLNVSGSLVYQLVEAKKIPVCRIGNGRGAIRFRPADIEAYITSCVDHRMPIKAPSPSRARLKHVKVRPKAT